MLRFDVAPFGMSGSNLLIEVAALSLVLDQLGS